VTQKTKQYWNILGAECEPLVCDISAGVAFGTMLIDARVVMARCTAGGWESKEKYRSRHSYRRSADDCCQEKAGVGLRRNRSVALLW
jgi:hypothetical protein